MAHRIQVRAMKVTVRDQVRFAVGGRRLCLSRYSSIWIKRHLALVAVRPRLTASGNDKGSGAISAAEKDAGNQGTVENLRQ